MEKFKRRNVGLRLGISGGLLCLTIAIAILVSTPRTSRGAQEYPTAAVNIIVPFDAGGGTDLQARVLAEELSKKWRQPVNVVNKPGGAGVVGTQGVMASAPDGYTLLMESPSTSASILGMAGLPFDVMNRTYLALFCGMSQIIIGSINAPWKSLQELADAGRKDPSCIVWGAAAGGRGGSDIVQLQFFEAAGIDVSKTKRVDFTGSGTAIGSLAGGHINLHATTPATVRPVVSGGKATCLGVAGPQRSAFLPDCSTTREAGFPMVEVLQWGGLSGPPGLPAHVKKIIIQAAEELSKDPAVVEKLGKRLDAKPTFLGPEAFERFIREEANKIARLRKLMFGGN